MVGEFQRFAWIRRNGENLRTVALALLLPALALALAYKSLPRSHSGLYLWPATGVQLSVLLPGWKNHVARRWGQAAGAVGVFLGCFLSGHPFWFSCTVAAVSLLDVWVVGAIVSSSIRGFEDLKQRRNLWNFILGSLAGPFVGASLASLPVALSNGLPLRRVFISALFADILGIFVLLPAMLFVTSGKYRDLVKLAPHLKRASGFFLLYTAAVLFVFGQTRFPLLFLVFPPMVLLVVSMGLEGGVYVSVFTTAAGLWATAHGRGPIMLIAQSNPDRYIVLQSFLALVAVTALPVGALWDERLRAEKAASEASSVYHTLLAHTQDMIVLSSLDGAERYVSPACERLTGWKPEEFLALDRASTYHPSDIEMTSMMLDSIRDGKLHHQIRYRIAQKEGGWRWVEASVTGYLSPITGEVAGYVGTLHDITQHYEIEEQRDALARDRESLTLLAQTDPLTGLPNRRAFDAAMQTQVFSGFGAMQSAVLMLIDIDNFKLYNDTYGHEAGDRALCAVAAALRSTLSREADFVGRWGGEEFVVLLPATNLRGAQIVAAELLRSVRMLNIEHEHSHRGCVTVSIGMAPLDADSRADSRAWIQKADRALYESKRMGKDQARVNLALYEHEATEALAS